MKHIIGIGALFGFSVIGFLAFSAPFAFLLVFSISCLSYNAVCSAIGNDKLLEFDIEKSDAIDTMIAVLPGILLIGVTSVGLFVFQSVKANA